MMDQTLADIGYALAFQRDKGTWQAKVTGRPDAACALRQAVTDAAQAGPVTPGAAPRIGPLTARHEQLSHIAVPSRPSAPQRSPDPSGP